MKTIISFFFALAFFIQAPAQMPVTDTLPWCPEGATWVYKSFSPSSLQYYKFKYKSDTVLQDREVKVWVVTSIEIVGGINGEWGRMDDIMGREYLYESNDSVYWYDKVNERFNMIYYFSAEEGDHWTVSNSRAQCLSDSLYPESDSIYVYRTDYDTIANRIYRKIHTSSNRRYRLGSYLTGIGPLFRPFPEINGRFCDYRMAEYGDFYEGGLKCYSDNLRGNVISENIGAPLVCQDLITSTEEIDAREKPKFGIYPNPADNEIFLKTGNREIRELGIYNILGTLVLQDRSGRKRLSIARLKSGIYLLVLQTIDGEVYSYKFIKTNR